MKSPNNQITFKSCVSAFLEKKILKFSIHKHYVWVLRNTNTSDACFGFVLRGPSDTRSLIIVSHVIAKPFCDKQIFFTIDFLVLGNNLIIIFRIFIESICGPISVYLSVCYGEQSATVSRVRMLS